MPKVVSSRRISLQVSDEAGWWWILAVFAGGDDGEQGVGVSPETDNLDGSNDPRWRSRGNVCSTDLGLLRPRIDIAFRSTVWSRADERSPQGARRRSWLVPRWRRHEPDAG